MTYITQDSIFPDVLWFNDGKSSKRETALPHEESSAGEVWHPVSTQSL